MRDGKCPKCGSSEVVPSVRVLDRGDGNWTSDLQVAVDAKPDALLFKGRQKSSLTARVCSACGYAELYATDPQALLAAYRERVE